MIFDRSSTILGFNIMIYKAKMEVFATLVSRESNLISQQVQQAFVRSGVLWTWRSGIVFIAVWYSGASPCHIGFHEFPPEASSCFLPSPASPAQGPGAGTWQLLWLTHQHTLRS